MEAHTCNHPKVPHTVIWWVETRGPRAPSTREFDDLEAADIFAQKLIRQHKDVSAWLKIYRTDNEFYVCFNWDNFKKEMGVAGDNTVKLEVDMEPMKEAFDNIALGFKNQGTSIAKLWVFQGITAGLVITDLIARVF